MTAPLFIHAAVIGLGVGRQHALAYARAEGCRLRWVHDHDPRRMREVLDEVGDGAAASSLEQVLDDTATSIVSIASYDPDHPAQVMAALTCGKHVFCEKPLCRTEDELAAIRRAWAAAGRHLACNMVLRAAPLFGWLRGAIAEGKLGTVYAFDGDYLYGRLDKITAGWRATISDYSVMLGGGVHMVDLMLWAIGERPAEVTAVGSGKATAGTDFRQPDFVAATFQFPSGTVGRITANFASVHRHLHAVRVFGTRATFVLDDCGPRLHRERDPGAPPLPLDLPALPTSKGALIPDFVRRVRLGNQADAETRHEFDVTAACIAADRSVRTGRREEIVYE